MSILFCATYCTLSQNALNKFWVIAYIYSLKKMLYICEVRDLCGEVILAYRSGNAMIVLHSD